MDLIERQAAIDAIDETNWYHQNENKDMVSGANSAEHQPWFKSDDVYSALKSVPSVQPEQRWTPVSEKQPEETGTYMTTIDYGEYGLVTGQRYYHGGVLGWNDECVIAWMPLPEPWKGEDND